MPNAREDAPLAVQMRGVTKRFPGVVANDRVDFDLRPGEIHALLGENGAGKSTLMTVLAGLYKSDEGEILVNGKRVSFNSPKDAMRAGVGMIHQHFTLVPTQTVTENILLGMDEPRFLMRLNDYDKKMTELGQKYGMSLSPKAKIWQLSVGEQQRVEILKMLYRGVDILIMDEPTAVLAPTEIDGLIHTLRTMAENGKSIVFISHKLNEVMRAADRVTVLRQGKATASGVKTSETSIPELAKLMVGRAVSFKIDKAPQNLGKPVLRMENVSCVNDRGLPALKNVSLTVRSGEIVGIAAVAGNGQRELADVITGMRKCSGGKIVVDEENVANQSALKAIRHGVAHVPEDRNHVGTAPNLSITDNLIMKSYRRAPLANGWSLNYGLAK
ncbi:MAG: ABC transporter ATP-binding protein, partial [Anaerolineae bacterium]